MNIDHLILLSNVTLGMKTETYKRFLHQKLSPGARLVGIKGPRGAGKTTLVEQYIPLEGTIRETFAAAMIGNAGYRLHYPPKGDFLVEDRYLFEVGGKNKSFGQIANVPENFVLGDDEEYGI